MAFSATPVQQATGSSSASLTTTVTLGAAPTAGNALILTFGSNGTAVTGVVGGGVTWVKAKASATNRVTEIWYGVNSSGIGTSIVVTHGSGNGMANVSEWSGMLNSGTIVDASASSASISANLITGTIATTDAGDLIVACTRFGNSPTLNSIPAGWTALSTPNTTGFNAAFILPGATGSYSGTWVMSTTAPYDAEIVAFVPAGGGGVTPPKLLALLGVG